MKKKLNATQFELGFAVPDHIKFKELFGTWLGSGLLQQYYGPCCPLTCTFEHALLAKLVV